MIHTMIEIRGTSHVAGDDLENIRNLVLDREPDVVALELDERRLKALLTEEERGRVHNPFLLLLKTVQDLLSRQTGVVPGSDMLAAFKTAAQQGTDIALIDQDIRVTFQKLKEVSLLEKIKFAGFLSVGMLVIPVKGFDLDTVPDENLVDRLLLQFEVSFPGMYEVLVEERNYVMGEKLKALDRQYDHVLAFVGAGHVSGIQERLDTQDRDATE